MLLQITYQDKATQTEKENTIEDILKAITTLCIKVDSMDNEIQKLKTNEDNLKSKANTGQQHDCKNAELSQSEDFKNPELKSDVGKHLKTHNICLNTAAECCPGLRLRCLGVKRQGKTPQGPPKGSLRRTLGLNPKTPRKPKSWKFGMTYG
ncbi:hypothetical protein MTR67_019896 [Solanum verrucosum]|uniref:Uncharacterized protein n=1 Tax=Solanum verrucosum TaxID=315347 RepID=A0AAF0TNN8_SOLVR|nr:hypothetical protein MTR67_019896 [Solanum verrucosum]